MFWQLDAFKLKLNKRGGTLMNKQFLIAIGSSFGLWAISVALMLKF
jgi:hypothetical protein